MTAKEWLGVMQQAENYNPAMTPLIIKYGEMLLSESPPVEAAGVEEKSFQNKVFDWCMQCFGDEITHDITERNHRFLEEALELVQATGATQSECHQLVDYVFSRDIGEINQELGGVMVTLAALSNALGLMMDKAGELEVTRIWSKIEKIRAKQAAKPKHSPLPETSTITQPDSDKNNYWKQRCEAAEMVIKSVNSNGGTLSCDVEAKLQWQSLKQQNK